jgi:hypothetical protein
VNADSGHAAWRRGKKVEKLRPISPGVDRDQLATQVRTQHFVEVLQSRGFPRQGWSVKDKLQVDFAGLRVRLRHNLAIYHKPNVGYPFLHPAKIGMYLRKLNCVKNGYLTLRHFLTPPMLIPFCEADTGPYIPSAATTIRASVGQPY